MADGQSHEVVNPIAYREIGQQPNADKGQWLMADGNFLKVVRFSNPAKVAISHRP